MQSLSPQRSSPIKHKPKPSKNTKKRKKSKWPRIIIGFAVFIALILVALAGFHAYLVSSRNFRSISLSELGERPYFTWAPSADTLAPDELRRTLIAYLATPELVPKSMLKQLNDSEAIPLFYSVEEDRLYCTIPQEKFAGASDFLKLTAHPDRIQRAKHTDDGLILGTYNLDRPNQVFFSFPAQDLIINPSTHLVSMFGSALYNLRMKDLVHFHYNRVLYGGRYVNQCRSKPDTVDLPIIDCGAFTAYPGEPTLKVLTQQLTDPTSPQEKRAQQLLNFVTTEIKFDADKQKPMQLIKKPNEILMTGSCGLHGRVILLASLLEQTDIDYYIVYTADQAALVVEGDFPQQRGALDLKINGRSYHLADISNGSFTIGSAAPFSASDIRYIQRPGINSRIYDLQTGAPAF